MTFFPIPDEFYRDAKYLSWSSDAYALWSIAGSWSADRLTDGLVPTPALALFPSGPAGAADELVERGVWRRARGGFQYIDWPEVCSRAYVEAKREAWRGRKQKSRSSKATPSRVTPEGLTRESTKESHGDSYEESHASSNPVNQEKEQETPTSSLARKRGSRIPADFAADEVMVAWARTEAPLVNGRTETANFIDYWTAAAGANASKRDWVAAWRGWMRKAQTDAGRRAPTQRGTNGGYQSQTDANIAAFMAQGGMTGTAREAITGSPA